MLCYGYVLLTGGSCLNEKYCFCQMLAYCCIPTRNEVLWCHFNDNLYSHMSLCRNISHLWQYGAKYQVSSSSSFWEG